MVVDVEKLKEVTTPTGMPFQISRLGHVVIQVSDLARSFAFYTQILGFKVSDIYGEDLMPGGMVFLRCNTDHHCLALIGAAEERAKNIELHHFAFEVATLEEVIRARDHLRSHNVPISFEGRRRAGCQIAVECRDPDNHCIEIYWGLDQVGSDGHVRPSTEWKGFRTLEQAIANPVTGQDTDLNNR